MENQKQNQNSLAERIKKRIFDRYPPKVDSAEKAVLCLRDACLQKRVSLFQSVTANIPIRNVRLKRILQDFRRGRYRKQIECLRAETDKKKRDELKMQLPAVTIQSEPCSKRGKAYCKNNALVCLDIDNVPDPEKLKQKIISLPYVLAVFISASGNGVFAICVLTEPATDLKPIMEAMQRDFEYPIDEKCSDVSRLRFVTYDPEPAVRKDITPFILPIKTNIVPRQANIVHDAEHRIDRARAYIEKMPPAISGQHGHDAALNVANKLYEFGLTENEAFRVFKEDYNHRCHPEWSDNEMQHKISEAFNKPLNEHGSKLRKNEQSKPDSRQQQSKKVEKRLRLTLSSEVVEKEITWLWCNKIPCGMLSLIAGLAGVGKSFWTVYMTAVITNGWDWPDGSPCERGSVLFFYGEEGIADTYKKRFQANGADQSKIVFLNGIESIDENKGHSEIDVTLEMVAEIEQAVKETAEKTGLFVKMVVIDPISNYWGNTKEDSNTGVRSVLKPLQLLAEKTGVAFVLIQHVGKGEKTYAQQRVLGSTGIVAACRSVWGIFIDPVDKDKRIFAKLKVNCGFNHTAVSYKIVPPDGKVEIVEASIEGLTGDDIESVRKAAQQVSQGRPPKAVAEVMAWLQNFLADGPKPSKVIMKEAKAKSFSKSTLDRAKENLSIKPKKDGMGGWTWELPSPEDTQI